MTDRLAAEVLSQYLDHLNKGHDYAETYLELCADYRADLYPLLAFARRLKTLLVPVAPSEQFARSLHARLIAAPVMPVPESVPSVVTRERVIVGMAALGSLAAVIVVLLRGRALGAKAA